jgi:hypothetical protein
MAKILLLFPIKRIDVFYFFENDLGNDYFILDDIEHLPTDFNGVNFIKAMYYWDDYLTPRQILSKIKPDKIIFSEIFDIKQIALCITANHLNIPTFFIDHGVYTSAEESEKTHTALEGSIFRSKIKKLTTSFIKIIKNRFFYYSVITSVSRKNLISYLKLPLSSFKALKKISFEERTPANFILFCKKNISRVDQIYFIKNKKLFLTGFPYYDNYFSLKSRNDGHIVYIEHPYLEDNDLGWNKKHHEEIATKLNQFAIKNRIKVYIKLHPRSNINYWRNYNFSTEFIEVIQFGNFEDIYFNANLILSYSSSLLIGFFSAKKNVVLLGWHPIKKILGINFFEMGLCHISFDINDLEKSYHYWSENNISEKNENEYIKFIDNYNFPFDGQATSRIFNVITNV